MELFDKLTTPEVFVDVRMGFHDLSLFKHKFIGGCDGSPLLSGS